MIMKDLKDGRTARLFPPSTSRQRIEQEIDMTKRVMEYGLRVPAVLGTEEIDGRQAIILETLKGENYAKWMERAPQNWENAARNFAFLHHKVHQYDVTELPSLKQRMAKDIQNCEVLPADLKSKVLERLKGLPDGNSLCHWNFIPENVIMTLDGPVYLFWGDAGRGSGLADVARTELLLRLLPADLTIKMLQGTYRTEYVKLCACEDSDIDAWAAPVAAGRLAERVLGERSTLLEFVKDSLRS